MELTLTLVAIGAGLALTVFAGWKSGRPRKDSLKARWISWPLVTLLGGAIVMLSAVHAAHLLGFNNSGATASGIGGF